MSANKNIDIPPETDQRNVIEGNIPSSSVVSSALGSVKSTKTSQQISSERQIKFERAQKCLENAALVSKRIKEQRKATAELLGRPFEDDDVDTASEMASTMSEKTNYSVATNVSTTLSVQDALNIPGISESLANTLKQKELLLERIKQYKEISKKPAKSSTYIKKEVKIDSKRDVKKTLDNSDISNLMTTIKDKENALSVMNVKIKAMETTILDLQEKINEKDQIIEAKNMATTLMSDTLSKKEKDSLILLEDTKQQMTKMQDNFVAMEAEWKQEKLTLLKEIETKEEKISCLEEANSILEASRFEISTEHAKLSKEIELKNKEITRLEEAIQNLSHVNIETAKEKQDKEEEKGSLEISGMVELTKKIELLEQINCQIRQTNKELENKLTTINTESKSPSSGSSSAKGSPLPNRKVGRNTASKMKSPWSKMSSETLPQDTDKKINKNEIIRLEMLVQSLNKDLLEKEYAISQKDAFILELQSIDKKIKEITKVDVAVCTLEFEAKSEAICKEDKNKGIEPESSEEHAINVKELKEKLKLAEEQIVFSNNEIDAANKNMIKVKSNHKLKLKQMQKTIDNFSKVSDSNTEIVKLNEELHQLSQKVAELEEEKGNLQLHLVDYDSGRLTESDIYKKMVEMENLAESRLKAISVLETQKFDLVQELHVLQQKNNEMEDKLADISQLQSEQVCSEIKSVQLEEQVDQLIASKKELEIVTENLKLDKEQLNGTIKLLEEKNEEIIHKLENYIQENMELTDKLEKLSAEKVSSAESIEIVESLTTQEKLELEEYNKNMLDNKTNEDDEGNVESSTHENIECLMEQCSELNKKIELFTREREEVIDKMNKINEANEILHQKIVQLSAECGVLQNNITLLNNEKLDLQNVNHELNNQLEEIKRERVEIIKETVEIVKSTNIEDASENAPHESQQDEKITSEKGVNRTKSVKQLTKEILKLKNTIKDREAEIADCQMKILSLEEHQQKQNDILQNNMSLENKIKVLTEENIHLKEEIESLKSDKESEQQLLHYKHAHATLQQEMQKVHQEYSVTVSTRDARINELENILVEYEKQLFNYGNTLQQKDKEINEFINQITQLNDISQKLKLTVELLEDEKAKDQNSELVRSLNKQTAVLQKKLIEYEDKIRILEEEKTQLLTLQNGLENKKIHLDTELRKLQAAYAENQSLIEELKSLDLKHSDEKSTLIEQTKERDEEIHEIKLQLRKESIENEKLRTSLTTKEDTFNDLSKSFNEMKQNLDKFSHEKDMLNTENKALESKNKELLEKLKKFAINIKKKTLMYTQLESTLLETQKQLQSKNEQLEQFLIQVETIPALRDKLKHAEEEINRLQSQTLTIEQHTSQDINKLQTEILSLENNLKQSSEEITSFNDRINVMQKELHFAREENINFKSHNDSLNKKLAEYEIDQKNNTNFETKISSLEVELVEKQNQITELRNKFEYHEQLKSQTEFRYDAKIQERDLYIESLEAEMNKYKNRICRLEESISVMENRRHSLERKADQLGSQLHEKQKAYSEYTNQEDELVGRLAVLIDHDRVVEKQLHEIENDNKDLLNRVQILTEENERLKKSLSDIQDYCNTLVDKATRFETAESDLTKYQSQLHELEAQLKRVTSDNQTLLLQKKQEIEELEVEFNSQIENSIKEKKVLSEKYEKAVERVSQLEQKLQENSINIEMLNKDLDDVNALNQELLQKSSSIQHFMPDYTQLYTNEINTLKQIIDSKDQEIDELATRYAHVHVIENKRLALVPDLQNKISQLSSTLNDLTEKNTQLSEKEEQLRHDNENLQLILNQKEEQIRDLVETKTLTFEMNIPKTEGMLISSTIEPMNEDKKPFDILSLESQIICNTSELPVVKEDMKKVTEQMQMKSFENVAADINKEEIIVPKKAYLCYNTDDNSANQEPDPFNSDEGWGFGDSENVDVNPGFTHLNEQIQQLQKGNDALKSELDLSNSKLLKAFKKLKELKNTNEVLSNEIKLSKQLQSSFLDTAIEDELRVNIEDLEKKIAELGLDLTKERREKEKLKKQNEVFNNANDRLTEMKEKLDNEIQLWKYKFKEANDKLSTMQWTADSKESPQHETKPSNNINEGMLKEEILKIEKENDELQSIIDHLTLQNNELTSKQAKFKIEIEQLNYKLQQQISSLNTSEDFNSQIQDLHHTNADLVKNNDILNKKKCDIEEKLNEITNKNETLQHINSDLYKDNDILNKKVSDLELLLNEITHNSKIQKAIYEKSLEDLETKQNDLQQKCRIFEEESERLKLAETEATNKLTELSSIYEQDRLLLVKYEQQLNQNNMEADNIVTKQYSEMEEQCKNLKHNIEVANSKILELELKNTELENISKDYIEQINKFNLKIQDLNSENDNLLSTVTELRSSLSSAIDQRGFEIAELWKQHLAQREADFQKLEHELRSQLNVSESKYEQLLDNVQSSSQEETNKLIMLEQVSSLQSKLQDKEEHISNLQAKYTDIMNQLDILRSEMEDEKVSHENRLLEQQEEYEKVIKDLRKQTVEKTTEYETNLKTIKSELCNSKLNYEELLQQNVELQNKIAETDSKTVDLTNELRLKDSELYQMTHDFNVTLTQRNEEFENVRKHLIEYEKKIEDVTYEKESELAVLRLKMHENKDQYEKLLHDTETEKTNLALTLEAKITECINLNKQITDLNKALEEHSTTATEMQLALENQEIEIVSLKDEIINLQNILKISNSKIQKHVSFASDTKPSNDDDDKSVNTLSKELLDAVPRAELDLALYMLHQRDVRCEELIMELTQLLEERDTLQLRLSDSLRSQEELKSKYKTAGGIDESMDLSRETITELPSFSMEKEQQFVNIHRGQTSRSSSISDPDGDKPKLQAKLTELRSVKHSRDVRLRQDSEQRQMDLRLLQRDVANLPPEAVDQLAQAHHTLSRDSQSTPTVLLNWLRGKSTPKVVHM